MAKTLQYFATFLLVHLLFSSSNVTEVRPVVMVKISGKPLGVLVKNSGPSPGIGHRSAISVEKQVDHVAHSGPSPGEGHK
ncbi:hypothetical protein RND71_035534 [Anisodus tanguticus]|uniref:Uncharacterized protein n=1 Tax=Anisodus tanguticus TaxID=243964 RepID=A0AAE1R5F2_9SOLA|nr:hypothetical protein RND71_035534 [Anisodus tanguticus]